MGGSVLVVSKITDFDILDLVTFDNKLLCIARSSVSSVHSIYKLNVSGDAWEELTTFIPIRPLDKFFIHNSSLYLYTLSVSGAVVYKLDGTLTAANLLIDDPLSEFLYHIIYSWGGNFYSGWSSKLYKSSLTEEGWVEVCSLYGQVKGLIDFGGVLYIETDNGFLSKLNNTLDGADFVCFTPASLSEPYGLYVFNNRLYYAGYSDLWILNEDESTGFTLLGYYNYSFRKLLEYEGYLYVFGGDDSYRIESDNSLYNLDLSRFFIGADVYQDKIYLSNGDGLYRYTSISIDSIFSDKQYGISPLSVQFSSTVFSDYPILSYDWDFGDGSPHSSDANPTHLYTDPDLYSISLTVTNALDSATYTLTDYIEVFPYVHKYIHTVEELQLIGNDVGWPDYGSYELANNIDASATTSWIDGFNPISLFRGNLEGNNFTISDLYINRPSDSNVSIFSTIAGVTISNVTIIRADITGDFLPSILASYVQGSCTLSNCNISGTVSSTAGNAHGVFCVMFYPSVITGCTVNVVLNNLSVGNQSGGLSGVLYNSIVSNCHVTMKINNGGGEYGAFAANAFESTITDSSAIVDIESYGGASNSGGFVGNSTSTFTNCHVEGTISILAGSINTVGGFMAYQYNPTLPITNCYSKVNISVYSDHVFSVAGFVGYNTGIIEDCYSEGNITIGTVTSVDQIGIFCGATGSTISNCHSIGNITVEQTQTATNMGGFIGYSFGGVFNKCYHVGDIQVKADYSTFIGGFGGYFWASGILADCFNYGAVEIQTPEGDYTGGFCGALFSDTAIRCYDIGGVYVTDSVRIGGFCGYLSVGDVIEQCFYIGTVTGGGNSKIYMGGFTGFASANEIQDCFVQGEAQNASWGYASRVGGFIGYKTAPVSKCYSSSVVPSP